jgi:hypothetical protein
MNKKFLILLLTFIFPIVPALAQYYPPSGGGGGGSGTVTNTSVVSANGFAGTVANSTTTPAITLSTSITGVLKGNGTSISAATAGTDYQAPITLTTTGTSGAATFSGNTLNIPQYSGGGSGLTSVGIQGDGIVINTTVANSPLTSNGTLGPFTLVNAPAYTVLGNFTGSAAAPTYSYAGLTGFGSFTTSTTLTASSPGVIYAGGTAQTYTLPLASTCIGKSFIVFGAGGASANTTLTVQGSDFIYYSTGSHVSSITIYPTTHQIVYASASGTWNNIGQPSIVATAQGTAGGVLYGSASGFPDASFSAQGSSGQLLQSAVASSPTWTSTPGSGTALTSITAASFIGTGSFIGHRTTVADAAYTTLSTDYIVAYTSLTAARTVTLVSSPTTSIEQIIKDESGNAGTYNITVQPASGTIDGSSTKVINANSGVLRLYYAGGNWFTW